MRLATVKRAPACTRLNKTESASPGRQFPASAIVLSPFSPMARRASSSYVEQRPLCLQSTYERYFYFRYLALPRLPTTIPIPSYRTAINNRFSCWPRCQLSWEFYLRTCPATVSCFGYFIRLRSPPATPETIGAQSPAVPDDPLFRLHVGRAHIPRSESHPFPSSLRPGSSSQH